MMATDDTNSSELSSVDQLQPTQVVTKQPTRDALLVIIVVGVVCHYHGHSKTVYPNKFILHITSVGYIP